MRLYHRFFGEHTRSLPWRPVPFALVAALVAAHARGADVNAMARSRSAALIEALQSRGMSCTEEDVTWLVGARGIDGAVVGGGRALVRASAHGEPTDLYLVEARLSPEGALLDVGTTWNITRTTGVDEARPLVRGAMAAFSTSVDGTATGIHTIDLAGRAPAQYTDFTRLQRWQTSLTNLQQTGQTRGVVHNAFALDPVATQVTLDWKSDDLLDVRADGRAILIDTARATAVDGAGWVRLVPEVKARPGNLVTWSVDRFRAMPWFGEEKMQVVKAIAFTGLDYVLRLRTRLLGDSSASEVAEDMGGLNSGAESVSYTDPEIGWPPAPIKPLISPGLPGEGQWIALDHDPFITQTPGAPSAFVTSFLRSDKARPQTRVYVTVWDPRQIALHMEAGTVEPVSATGEAGPGVIPRTPEVIRRVVAGFNGGFQALHGEFGMQADGVLYLPPKPYAATVLELRDGSTAFGSWPGTSDVPDEVLSYRQNLTALVEHDKFNPWGRNWWGGTPKGWADNVHTTRSGVCLTKESYVGYFFGVDISAEVLANAMLQARCAYGVHLDMNPGLAGFEFYNVQPVAAWQPLGRKLQEDWEYEGTIKELPEFKYRARRMIKGMQHMNFPQYIHRDGRDFFYLTQRPVLPGPELTAAVIPKEAGEGTWRVKGLPQHGFPYALATAWTRPDAAHPAIKVRALRVDPRTVRPAGSPGTTADTPTVVSFVGGDRSKGSDPHVWFASGVFLLAASAPEKDATPIASGVPLTSPSSAKARAAAGIHDEDGMLEWLELAPEVTADATTALAMDGMLARAGCSSRMLVLGDPHALLGGTLDIAGEATAVAAGPAVPASRLVRGPAPGAHAMFETTQVVGPAVWQPLQNQRVRYFRKAGKRKAEADAGAPRPGELDPEVDGDAGAPPQAPPQAPPATPGGAPGGASPPSPAAPPAPKPAHAAPARPAATGPAGAPGAPPAHAAPGPSHAPAAPPAPKR
jgi:hypothetical protein